MTFRGLARLTLIAALLPSLSIAADLADNSWYRDGRHAVAEAKKALPVEAHARNVILFIGDGMGIPTVTAARILAGQREGRPGEDHVLSFERFPWLAVAKTYNTNQQVADSAGTVTAMVTGVKTKAGVLNLDDTARRGDASSVASSRIPTLFEQAEGRGLATGIVTTTRVTHATPSGAFGHSPERNWESDGSLTEAARQAGFPDLAVQMMEFPNGATGKGGKGLDVVLGGGSAMFLPSSMKGRRHDGRNLIAEWQSQHPAGSLPRTRKELMALDPSKTDQVLGLFSSSHMDFEVDRIAEGEVQPSLAEMTRFAIRVLSKNKKGYVLMVEGGRIDHAHHMNNAYRALDDTLAFDKAVQTAIDETNPQDTLIIVTADHGHVVSIGGFPTRGNPILGLVHDNDGHGEALEAPSEDLTGKPYTTLSYANGPGYHGRSDSQNEGAKHFPHAPGTAKEIKRGRADLSKVDTQAPNYLQETTLPLAYESHSGEDVPVYASGPGASLFRGVVEQSYLYHAIRESLGWDNPSPAKKEPAKGANPQPATDRTDS